MIRCLRYLGHRFRGWLLGYHPYNTVFNYNWVNVRPMIRTFRNLKGLFRGRVADLGAGASPYYDLIASEAEVYIAVDYPSAFLQEEKRSIERVVGLMEQIPIANQSIDTVFCTQALYQVKDPTRALQEIARILRTGGYAIISVPHISPLHSEPYDLYRFTPDGLRWLAHDAGLQTQSVHIQGQLFASFALCLAMNLVLSHFATGQSMQLLQRRQLLLAPLIALINVTAWLLDSLLPFNRTPSNFILVAVKT